MYRNEPSIVRPVIGIAAALMAVLTIGAAVVLPARLGSAPQSPALAGARAPSLEEVAIVPGRIEVIGVRRQAAADERRLAAGEGRNAS
jgi:hypothetical protein